MRYLCLVVLTPLLAQDVGVPFRAAVATGTPAVVRLLAGVPGATVLGEPLSVSESVVAPGHGWAIADAGDGVELIRLAGGLARNPIPGALAGASVRAFSANGAALALYHQSSGVVLVAGLPNAARTLAAGFPAGAESVAAMAVSGDARLLVVADTAGNVFRWDGAWSAVAGAAGIAAVDLRGDDCLLASREAQLIRWRSDESPRVLVQLPLTPGGQMARSADGRRAVIVAADGRGLMAVDLDVLTVTEIGLTHGVTSLTPAADGEFLLGSENGEGAWSLDRNLRVSFLPAAKR